ncbi:5'-methylthioadenosine/adenosylhomocysteine nucleosidase [Atopobacter phocae]|uniref:5'-methylthioadenosine/adenosylhomocysteine nucleosidase n=1 Tax=Atopobacter phocae TaxID=136492 RepID=UPI0004718BE2|nr:5'-methylthioadenosine/adenosylhomocysteine nucleosidase [Atopobacter phocae]
MANQLKIGIIAAMAQEIKILKEVITEEHTETILGFNFIKGTIHGVEVVLVESGIGKVMAAMVATILIERFEVSALINTGSAGGVNAKLSVGDLVLSNRLVYSDVDVTGFNYDYGQLPQMPTYYTADDRLLASFEAAGMIHDKQVHTGLIATADSFINQPHLLNRILDHFPETLATEMEGAAIAQVAHVTETPCIVIRAISDVAGKEETATTFDQFIIEAGRRSAELVIEGLKNIQTNWSI